MQPIHPLSVFRYCPRCGSADCESPTIKQFVCRACGLQYFQNAAAAVIAVIRDPERKVLFTRREREPAKGKLDLPGGFVDPMETAETALTREVEEETGLIVTDARYLTTFTNRYDYSGVTYYTLDLVFQCAVPDLNPVSARDEVTEITFRSPSDVAPDEIGFESIRRVMQLLTGLGTEL